MLNESRIDIYNYLYGIFHNTVTKNVYLMEVPQELTKSDVSDGFVVILIGALTDESEFKGSVYGDVRCYVVAYVPTKSRGRLDAQKYKAFEASINAAIQTCIENPTDSIYSIQEGSFLSTDDFSTSPTNNPFHTFVRSFVMTVENNQE